jgi:two-component system, chemotaxis family, CheB/CheR fusion protein
MPDKKSKTRPETKAKAKPEKKPAAKKNSPPKEQAGKKHEKSSIPVVAIGASAGGLEAIQQFFDHMPDDSGVAFVVVTHLDPSHTSLMPELMQKHTRMKVDQVKDGMEVEPDHVYVIPPDRDMGIMNDVLVLSKLGISGGPRAPVNYFLRSLAKEKKEKAFAVILSGMGTDGTEGIRAVKADLGMVMVQDPSTAKHDGMPKSVISTGLADYVLPPQKMPGHLIDYLKRFPIKAAHKLQRSDKFPANSMRKVHMLIRNHTGHDFSDYKENTILRRIQRRMSIHKIEDSGQYVQYLEKNSQEVKSLFKELLIGVTSFFRDPEAFDSLKNKALPLLFEERAGASPLRMWVPGCATGEEAYSVAIAIREFLGRLDRAYPVQIFATDIDENAIEKARTGLYPGNIASDVGPERLQRFFERVDDSYQINRRIREMLVFAAQSVTKDPPFTKLDLICCRNLLIYLDSDMQKKLLPLFHYSLNPGGILFLGSSETVGESAKLFSILDNKWKIYKARDEGISSHPPIDFPLSHPPPAPRGLVREGSRSEMPRLVERYLLEYHTPPALVVDQRGDIAYIHGRTGKYIEPPAGLVRTANAIEMARDPMKSLLPSLIRTATADKKESSRIVRLTSNGRDLVVRVSVKPLIASELKGMFMILFYEMPMEEKKETRDKKADRKKADASRVRQLEEELRSTREGLQTTIEEFETSNEELRSMNEEYQSANEELQSANEELNSSKEEMQSLNEELETVNRQLESKNQELVKTNEDLKNLLDSLNLPVVFMDNQLRIKRFTSNANRLINLRETDVGRPLGDLTLRVKYKNLLEDAEEVLQTLLPKELEIEGMDQRWYTVRIRPYRTLENVIDGLVILFVDIHKRKTAEEALEKSEVMRRFAENVVNTVRQPLIVMDEDSRITSANRSFYDTFKLQPGDSVGRRLYELRGGAWDIPELRKLLEHILPEQTTLEDFEMELDVPGVGIRRLHLNARSLQQEESGFGKILLAIEVCSNQ